MNKLPLVSVITPSFNQGDFIEETIRSVQDQEYKKVEHLVMDGGSTDNTINILKRYDHLVWVSETDKGQADAVNKGFNKAKGEIFGWLNSDDLYLPKTIRQVVDYFLAHPFIDIVYGDCYEMDGSGNISRLVKAHPIDLKRLLLLDFTVYQPSFFFRREAVQKIGPLNIDLYMGLDYDYIIRAVQNCALTYLPYPLAVFRTHSSSKTATLPGKFLQDYLAVFDAIFSNPDLPVEFLKLRRRVYSNAYLSFGERSFLAGQLGEAKERIFKALRIYPQPFRPRSFKGLLLLLDLYFGSSIGRNFLNILKKFKNPNNTSAPFIENIKI